MEDISPFCGVIIPLFWPSGVIVLGFKASLDSSLACFIACTNGFPRFTGRPLKARPHGAFFFCAFAMQKMDYVGVNKGVHTVRLQVRAMHWCVRCCT